MSARLPSAARLRASRSVTFHRPKIVHQNSCNQSKQGESQSHLRHPPSGDQADRCNQLQRDGANNRCRSQTNIGVLKFALRAPKVSAFFGGADQKNHSQKNARPKHDHRC